MNVTLINYTPDALETLIFCKSTRLSMTPEGLEEIKAWPEDKKLAQLEYMRHTIKSQFEFVEYTFAIEGVSRAFTQQLERHRVGTSFSERSLRITDASDFDYVTGPSVKSHHYQEAMEFLDNSYKNLLAEGTNIQDARGILPLNICTSIVFKANLRTLHEMAFKRLCVRTQGEFQDIFRLLRARVIAVHPWAGGFIKVWCAQHGTCQFHAFPVDKCPVKPGVYDPYSGAAYDGGPPATVELIQIEWERNRADIQPVRLDAGNK